MGEWDAFMDDVAQTLDKFAVPPTERAEVVAIVESTRASPGLAPSSGWQMSAIPPLSGGKQTIRRTAEIDARDVVDNARSRHRMCHRVIVEQRITGGGRPNAG
jgi:hypothetical protein